MKKTGRFMVIWHTDSPVGRNASAPLTLIYRNFNENDDFSQAIMNCFLQKLENRK
jgi:hypothetical protein